MKVFAVALALALASSASVASADSSFFIGPDVGKDQPIVIDTLGEAETIFRAWSSPGSKSKPSRWTAKLAFWIHYPAMASDDTVTMQVFKGRKKLGKPTPCTPKQVFDDAKLAFFDCQSPAGRDYPKLFRSKGEHIIKLSYKKLVEGKTFADFATFRVMPTELKKGSANSPVPSWAEDHDMKLTVSTIEEKVANGGRFPTGTAKNAIAAAKRAGIPYMLVHTWFKREKRVPRTKITCLYGGKRVAEANATGNHEFSSWSFVRRGSSKRDESRWEQAEYFLHSLHPRPAADGSKGSWSKPQHWMNENPGEYKCVITGDGEVLKELYFTVGKDGEIVKPPCQLASMNSLKTVTLLSSSDKALSDRKYDKKRGKKLGYEGRVSWAKGCPPTR